MSFFGDLKAALEQDVAASVIPVLVADLQAIKANPPDLTDPVARGVMAVKLQADVLAALPALDKAVVGDVAGLLATYLQKVQAPAIAAAAKPAG